MNQNRIRRSQKQLSLVFARTELWGRLPEETRHQCRELLSKLLLIVTRNRTSERSSSHERQA